MMDFNPEFHESLPEVGEPAKNVCAVCQSPSDKSCGACHSVDYCSAEHQKTHWKVHKKDCSPIEISTLPELGRHFVATRDLPPWTLLLTEHPVLVNPLEMMKGRPPCISCCSILPATPWTCSKCSTSFFCSQSCSMNKVHSEFECGVLSKCSVEQRNRICMEENLGYLRAIHLKNSDPGTWAKVLRMRGADYYNFGDFDDENDKWFVRKILPLIGEKGVGFEGDMVKLWGINERAIVIGMHTIDRDHGASELLYLKASEYTQNCFPNCSPIIGKGPQLKLQVRNTIQVKKGQILSIDFGIISQSLGAIALHHLRKGIQRALCICPRCSDPTELGTMQSAVKCTLVNCKDGYLLPVDVRNMAMDAPWRCNRPGCKGKGSTWREIDKLGSKCKGDIAIFRRNVPLADFERTSEFWESLKKKLHPNHYIVHRFEKDLVNEVNGMIEREVKFSAPRLDLHISMLEHLLKMADMINPGINLPRAYIVGRLFNGLNKRLLWNPVFIGQKDVQKGLMKRAVEVIDTLLPIAKFYPEVWTPPTVQYLTERRGRLQMVLNCMK